MDKLKNIQSTIESARDRYSYLLKTWIQQASTAGNETGIQELIAERLSSSGMEVDHWELDYKGLSHHPSFSASRTDFVGSPNVIGVLKGTGGGRSLILNGHVDVVPEGDREQWDEDPYSGEVKDGKMYGRGTTDMKGGILASLIAVETLQNLGIQLKGDIIFQSVVEEESGGSGTLAAIERGYKADAAIIPEPTQMKIVPKQQGSIWFRVKVHGISAHGGTRYEGTSAIEKAWTVYEVIMKLEKDRNHQLTEPLFEGIPIPLPINVGKISGGNWPSSVPDEVTMEGRLGIGPNETMKKAKQEFEGVLSLLEKKDEWFRKHPVEVEWFGARWIPGDVALDHPLMRVLTNKYQDVTGREPVVQASNWGTDGGLLNQVGGVPSIVFGPGKTKMAHFPNEYIDLDNVFEIAEILAHTIIDWCQVE